MEVMETSVAGGGGGSSSFILQNGELQGAAGEYGTASSSYVTAKEALLTAMKSVNWNDEAGQQWQEICNKATQQLDVINKNLDGNNKLLSTCASKAAELQVKVRENVSKIYS